MLSDEHRAELRIEVARRRTMVIVIGVSLLAALVLLATVLPIVVVGLAAAIGAVIFAAVLGRYRQIVTAARAVDS